MKTFYDIIYQWVAENFGQSEADDPSWNIKALAEHLRRSDIDPDELNAYTKSTVYADLDQHYIEEDIENYIDGLNVYELTPQQIHNVADKIRNSEWYMSINPEDMEWYIKRELEKGE